MLLYLLLMETVFPKADWMLIIIINRLHTEPHLETVSSVSRRLRLAREIALLSGSGNTGAMWRTSGDPGCSLTNHSSAACSPPIRAHLTPPSRQPREVAGEEGPDSQVRLSHSPAPYTARSP